MRSDHSSDDIDYVIDDDTFVKELTALAEHKTLPNKKKKEFRNDPVCSFPHPDSIDFSK